MALQVGRGLSAEIAPDEAGICVGIDRFRAQYPYHVASGRIATVIAAKPLKIPALHVQSHPALRLQLPRSLVLPNLLLIASSINLYRMRGRLITCH